ncbi:Extracellular solute-binding protein, family 3 [Candidatus Magnetomorum sp. HK-1]|nr:Extracellular solute-binding protein, family 3 [Candidatus Magnetomorum sp. HK-1]
MKYYQLIIFLILIESSLPPAFAIHLSFATQNLEPYSFLNEKGEPSGPSVDIANAVCDEMKANCVIDLYPWRRAYYEVQRSRVNGVFFIGKNPEREEWLHFSPPIIQIEYGFFVHKQNSMTYNKPVDITGYIVGVFGPSNTSASLNKIKQNMNDFYIDMEDNDESGFRKLSVKRVNAVFSNRDVGYSLIKKLKLLNIRYAGPHKKLSYYFGFNPKLTPSKWIDNFNQAYIKLYYSGKIKEILKPYDMKPALLN